MMDQEQTQLQRLYGAWQKARRHKKPSMNQLAFEAGWLTRLLAIQEELAIESWQPRRTVCFVTTHPKTREIHAPDFADRVVHHYLVPQLQALYEPVFIHDSYANRAGKGSHQAVQRVQQFMRQVVNQRGNGVETLHATSLRINLASHGIERGNAVGLKPDLRGNKVVGRDLSRHPYVDMVETLHVTSVQELEMDKGKNSAANNPHLAKKAYYLQLDIHNFFNSVNRHILYQQLSQRLAKAERKEQITAEKHQHLKTLCHTLVNQKPAHNTVYRGTAAEHALVPPHKRLLNAKKQCGMAVGNLSSQFFANVYLNALDQFVKHTLKCQHYVRYVDDFVLLHHSPQQLLLWREQITVFLANELGLQLKCNANNTLPMPQPVNNGCDFLGYVIYPQHKTVRARVIKQCRKKLQEWSALYVIDVSTKTLMLTMQAKQQIRALVASYWGHFGHACHWRLTQRLLKEFFWLRWLFVFSPRQAPQARFAAQNVQYFAEQVLFFQRHYPRCHLSVQKGCKTLWLPYESANKADFVGLNPDLRGNGFVGRDLSRQPDADIGMVQTLHATSVQLKPDLSLNDEADSPIVIIKECGILKNGLKRREVSEIIFPSALFNINHPVET